MHLNCIYSVFNRNSFYKVNREIKYNILVIQYYKLTVEIFQLTTQIFTFFFKLNFCSLGYFIFIISFHFILSRTV